MKRGFFLLLVTIILITSNGCSLNDTVNAEPIETASRITITQPKDDTVNGYRVSESKNKSKTDFTDTKSQASDNSDSSVILYYANTKSKKFHLKDCIWAKNLSNENLLITENRDELISEGFEPCKKCNP